MKNLLIDTNIYTHALAGDSETIDVLQHSQNIQPQPIRLSDDDSIRAPLRTCPCFP